MPGCFLEGRFRKEFDLVGTIRCAGNETSAILTPTRTAPEPQRCIWQRGAGKVPLYNNILNTENIVSNKGQLLKTLPERIWSRACAGVHLPGQRW